LFQQLLATSLPRYSQPADEPMRVPVPSLGSPMKVALPAGALLRCGFSELSSEVGRGWDSLSDSICWQSEDPLCREVPDAEEASSEVTAQSSVSSEMVVPVPPGLDPPLGMPSHGSVLHSLGSCRPCGFFWKSTGCQNGKDCQHCHLCPEGKAKHRKKQRQAQSRAHTLAKSELACPTPSTSASDDDTMVRGADSRRPSLDSVLSFASQ